MPIRPLLRLIYDGLHRSVGDGEEAVGFEGAAQFFTPGIFDNGRTGRGGMLPGWESMSGEVDRHMTVPNLPAKL